MLLLLLVSTRTPRKGILLFLLSSCVKLKTGFFESFL